MPSDYEACDVCTNTMEAFKKFYKINSPDDPMLIEFDTANDYSKIMVVDNLITALHVSEMVNYNALAWHEAGQG